SAVREWKMLRSKSPKPGLWEGRLRQLADTLEQIHFSTPPQLELDVQGDARDFQSFTVRLNLNTPDADTSWGTLQHGTLSLLLHPTTSNALSHAELNLQAESAQTR